MWWRLREPQKYSIILECTMVLVYFDIVNVIEEERSTVCSKARLLFIGYIWVAPLSFGALSTVHDARGGSDGTGCIVPGV